MKRKIKILTVLSVVLAMLTSCSTITVRTGDNFEIVELPDRSLIYMNRYSYVKYDKNFSQRNVEQTGEVYFIVTPGENPFVVFTPSGEIKVTGTQFNVKSDDDKLEVEVEEGNVELEMKQQVQKLKAGEKALFVKSKNLFEKCKAQFKCRIWTNDMKNEFRKLGKEFKRSGKEIGKDFKSIGKEIINGVK